MSPRPFQHEDIVIPDCSQKQFYDSYPGNFLLTCAKVFFLVIVNLKCLVEVISVCHIMSQNQQALSGRIGSDPLCLAGLAVIPCKQWYLIPGGVTSHAVFAGLWLWCRYLWILVLELSLDHWLGVTASTALLSFQWFHNFQQRTINEVFVSCVLNLPR